VQYCINWHIQKLVAQTLHFRRKEAGLWDFYSVVALKCRQFASKLTANGGCAEVEARKHQRHDIALAIERSLNLTAHPVPVFMDYDGIASGNFDAVILENIRARAHFLVLLTPTALERCSDPEGRSHAG
jgi:hypothetical protein